jgi:hypothetical protein
MPVERTKSLYARTLKETVAIRRYTGAGPNRPFFDYPARARVRGYVPEEMVGTIIQGDRKAIVYAPDLVDGGFPFPVTNNDKLIERGKELAILAADQSTRRDDDVLIAIEIQARGQGAG